MEQEKNMTVPGAIVAAGVIIALAVLYTGGGKNGAQKVADTEVKTVTQKQTKEELAANVKPVSSADHIIGNPNAPVKIIEFSDIQCPYCQQFHPTLLQAMDEYGKAGKVAWIYRHFPLVSIHPLAMPAALASECVAEQGGNDMFWAYLNKLFADGLTSEQQISDTAKELGVVKKLGGLDMASFKTCLETQKYKDAVEAEIQNAIDSGVSGTPTSIVLDKNGKVVGVLGGASPYAQVKALIDVALTK